MSTHPVPRVSIGLPVYNGENYLAATLDSILSQTYTDFELIVSDNASSDRTAEICQAYTSRDRRLRYVRNAHNIGAAANYNRTFELSRGELFKWHAHDDLLAPTFLEKCVALLDANPDAVLCQSLVEYIDENGKHCGFYDNRLPHADALQPSRRFAATILVPHSCTDIFGVARRQAMVGTVLNSDFHGTDRALVAELALRGRLLKVPEPLFLNRDHPARYTRTANRPQDRQLWHAGRVQRRHYPIWRLYSELWHMVPRNLTDWQERQRCYGYLLRWWLTNWNWARMAVDVLAVINPDVVERAQRFKQRMFDPEPGPGNAKLQETHHPPLSLRASPGPTVRLVCGPIAPSFPATWGEGFPDTGSIPFGGLTRRTFKIEKIYLPPQKILLFFIARIVKSYYILQEIVIVKFNQWKHTAMTTIFVDSDADDAYRRERLYAGDIFVFSPRPGTLALCEFARQLLEEAFGADVLHAQYRMPVEEFVAIFAPLKPQFIHHPRTKELIRQVLRETGCDLSETYLDVPRLRGVTSDGYLTSGVGYAHHPHRDTWYSAPMCQLNWWLPIYAIERESSMSFHARYWKTPTENDSQQFNYFAWNATGRKNAAHSIKSDTRQQPRATQSLDLEPEYRVVGKPGSIIMFSGAQLHSTVPNTSGRTRFSIDFRTVNITDVMAHKGAPNVDSHSPTSALRDFMRATDLCRVSEDLIKPYEKEGVAGGELVFQPNGELVQNTVTSHS